MNDKPFGERLHRIVSKAYDKWVENARDNPLIMANAGFETFLAGWQACSEANEKKIEAMENAMMAMSDSLGAMANE